MSNTFVLFAGPLTLAFGGVALWLLRRRGERYAAGYAVAWGALIVGLIDVVYLSLVVADVLE